MLSVIVESAVEESEDPAEGASVVSEDDSDVSEVDSDISEDVLSVVSSLTLDTVSESRYVHFVKDIGF